MSALMYRRAFADHYGLATLERGIIPEIADARRRIFINERAAGPDRPDHFYKNYLAFRLDHLTSVSQLPWEVLSAVADRFLSRSGGKLVVKKEEHSGWLAALPFFSPLAVSVAFLVKEAKGPPSGYDPRTYLTTELGNTALLAPSIPELETLIQKVGLNEMHMHLNGSTELDIIWSDAASNPDAFHAELIKAHSKASGLASELYDQIEVGLTPTVLRRRLRAVRRVRWEIANGILDSHQGILPTVERAPIESIMDDGKLDDELGAAGSLPRSSHPAHGIFPSTSADPLIEEAVWLYSALQVAREDGPWRHRTGLGLYFNFLVMTQLARMTVQQTDQVGFDQFQKFTVVGTRERIEAQYAARFRQLNIAPPYHTIRHLEGRLAPKQTPEEVAKLIATIVDGYLEFRGCLNRPRRDDLLRFPAPGCLTGACGAACKGSIRGRPDAELALVVHFIKRDFPPSLHPECLDHELRAKLDNETTSLVAVLRRFPLARQMVTGVDAAANEMHAAPEVFARTFRTMRHNGVRRATYHVGEDFAHLVSGIRATAEALTFLSLKDGDRIGHGTALGVSPTLWRERTGERIMLPLGEQLDNAVFAFTMLSRSDSKRPAPPWLADQIKRLTIEIYGRAIPANVAAEAWGLRSIDILEILSLEREEGLLVGDVCAIVDAARNKALRVVSPEARIEAELLVHRIEARRIAYPMFRQRHRYGTKLRELSEVHSAEMEDADLCELQDLILGDLNEAGVAIETLPSSNVRISIYHDLSEHHLFRWLKLTGEPLRNLPRVCVGSDDTGIFATSLRNEYAAVWEVLRGRMGRTSHEAATIIANLNRTGWDRRFAPSP